MNQQSAALSGMGGALMGLLGAAAAFFVIRKAIAAGWEPLRGRFPSTNPDSGGERTFESMSVRFNNYVSLNFGFCTALIISARSLHIRIQHLPLVPGSFFRPIELPWSAIAGVELKRSIFGYPVARVRVKDFSPVLTFGFTAARLIHEQWTQAGPPRR